MGTSDTWATSTDDVGYEVSVGVSIVSWLSGVGDFSSMSNAPTTTTASTTSSASTTTTSASPTPSDAIYIGLWEILEGASGIYTWIREWQVFEAPVGEGIDPCDTRPLDSETADTTGSDPGYPDVDLNFTACIEGCKYANKGKQEIGTMTCPGVDRITCRDDRDE